VQSMSVIPHSHPLHKSLAVASFSTYMRWSVLNVLNLACQVVLSDGSATVSLRFFREGQPMPWFRQNEVIAAWAVALLGTHTCACGGRI
jgi:hypothetical protein